MSLYKHLFIQELKNRMSYRMDFLISVIAMISTNIAGYLTFWIIFQNFNSIGGYNYYEMMFFYGFYLITITPCQVFFSNNWNLSDKVYTGDFIKYCIKPVNTFFYYYSETYDFNGMIQGFIGLAVMGYSWKQLGISITLFKIILVICEAIFASLILISLMNLTAATSFITINSDSLLELVNKLKEYARYPITVYNYLFTFVFSMIIPIGYISFYPSMIILDNGYKTFYCYLTPIMGVGMFYLSYKIWMMCARRYSGTGS
ncbi:ABC-2 family transporter protein [Clostridium sp. YIM B02505]|uniref:ABC-2 family transporter protein n=2 Tax=Clostridium yunnanense TaxID=2800325 RepID=A0ABS1EPD0_9CLOT|nr:ABC-2 family transporter protein [Clostridium yunnanense]